VKEKLLKKSSSKNITEKAINKEEDNATTTEEIIAKGMAELAELNSKFDEYNKESNPEDPSPKVEMNIRDTYQIDPDKSLAQELLEDFEKLELHFKLKENWLDISKEDERPFDPEYSIIKKPEELKRKSISDSFCETK